MAPLNEVTSKKAVRTQGLQTTVDKGGAVRVVKQKQRGNMPQTTEELRTVLRIEANTYCFHGWEVPQQSILQGHVSVAMG